jgi:uncharacterized HAD superfamily protein
LPPFRDALIYVPKLIDDGFRFHAITTVGRKHQVVREANLYDHYTATAFKEIHCLDGNECKGEYLKQYKDSGLFWIEDSVTNARIGQEHGLRSVLMNTPWNRDKPFNGPRVDSWSELYVMIKEAS